MGTKLVGTVLRRFPEVRLGNVVLVGCVLPTNYPWRQVRTMNPRAFDRVRNEVASKDLVPWLAHQGQRLGLLPDYGMAGCVGFDVASTWVHSLSSPHVVCGQCSAAPPPAPIHNVTNHQGTHSSAFADLQFAAYFWLPFLWNIDPVEYSEFFELCLDANEHFERRNWPQLREAEDDLLLSEWQWAGGATLQDHINRYLSMHPRGGTITTPVVGQVLQKMYVDIAAASDAFQAQGSDWKRKVAALHPTAAMIGAVDVIVR